MRSDQHIPTLRVMLAQFDAHISTVAAMLPSIEADCAAMVVADDDDLTGDMLRHVEMLIADMHITRAQFRSAISSIADVRAWDAEGGREVPVTDIVPMSDAAIIAGVWGAPPRREAA